MTSSLRDWSLKAGRGREHLKKLQDEIDTWAEVQGSKAPFTHRMEPDDTSKALVLLIDTVDPMPESWSLLVGDVLFNFRAALDYLAWYLVQVGQKPNPPDPTRVYFPAVLDPMKWKSVVNDRLPGIRDDHRTVIEKYQPYQLLKEGTNPSRHPFAQLFSLANDDKHKRITLLYSRATQYRIRPVMTVGLKVIRIQLPPPGTLFLVKPSTELGRIFVEPIDPQTTPQTEMYVEIHFSAVIAFENGYGVTGTLEFIDKVTELLFLDIEPLL